MKLSEAIRLGAMLKPQGKGNWSMQSRAKASCAIGAALQALGVTVSDQFDGYEALVRLYPYAYEPMTCPLCLKKMATCVAIYHLNDTHDWTREHIADWVATVEPTETIAVDQPMTESVEVRG